MVLWIHAGRPTQCDLSVVVLDQSISTHNSHERVWTRKSDPAQKFLAFLILAVSQMIQITRITWLVHAILVLFCGQLLTTQSSARRWKVGAGIFLQGGMRSTRPEHCRAPPSVL